MKLHRRDFVLGGAASMALPLNAGLAQARLLRPQPIEIRATPILSFSPREPEKIRFGALNFRSGLQISSRHDDFGGWSGLWRSPDGRQIVAVSDGASWLQADLVTENGKLSALRNAKIAPVLGADGRPLWRTRSYDCEALTIINGVAYVTIERTHEVMRFDWAKDGMLARGRSLPVPPEVKRLPSNKGLEAIGIIPAGHPLSGSIIAISERSGGMDDPTLAVLLGGPSPGLLEVKRDLGFDITDLAFLPGGDMLILERRFKNVLNVGMRIRRIASRSIKPGALLDGATLIEADLGQEIDNMEGITVHVEAGKTMITVISDDNFSMIQRTILLEFELAAS